MLKHITLFCLLLSTSLFVLAQEETYEQEIFDFRTEHNEGFLSNDKSPLSEEHKEYFEMLGGHPYFPIDVAYKVVADLKLTPQEKPFALKTSTDRLPIYIKYGIASFELKGETYELTILRSEDIEKMEGYEDYLFLAFTDLTSGEETYGGGRYIDLRRPKTDEGKIVIDFNKAYQPYCAYSDTYSCPIPPKENFLNTRIEAGIKHLDIEEKAAAFYTSTEASVANPVPTPTGWATISTDLFSFTFPENWEYRHVAMTGSKFLVSSLAESESDVFAENMNYLTQDISGMDMDLEAYTKLSVSQIETYFENAKLISSERMDIEGRVFQKVIYLGDQGGIPLKYMQYYWLEGDTAHILTFTSHQDSYDRYKPIMYKMMDSFQLK